MISLLLSCRLAAILFFFNLKFQQLIGSGGTICITMPIFVWIWSRLKSVWNKLLEKSLNFTVRKQWQPRNHYHCYDCTDDNQAVSQLWVWLLCLWSTDHFFWNVGGLLFKDFYVECKSSTWCSHWRWLAMWQWMESVTLIMVNIMYLHFSQLRENFMQQLIVFNFSVVTVIIYIRYLMCSEWQCLMQTSHVVSWHVCSYDDSWLAGYPGHMMPPPPPPMRGARYVRPPGPMIAGRAAYRAAGELSVWLCRLTVH